jgi:hypothetical protein
MVGAGQEAWEPSVDCLSVCCPDRPSRDRRSYGVCFAILALLGDKLSQEPFENPLLAKRVIERLGSLITPVDMLFGGFCQVNFQDTRSVVDQLRYIKITGLQDFQATLGD